MGMGPPDHPKSSFSPCPPSFISPEQRRSTQFPPFSLFNIMLVNNPLHQSSLTLNPNDLSDFVNMDLFTNQGSATSDSREPSPSVSTPLFSPLPIISEQNPSDWFNFSLEEDLVKPDPPVPPPVTSVPWDFLTFSNDSSDTGSASARSVLSPSFSIDPQLMSSPTPPTPVQDFDFGEVKDQVENGHEGEDEDEEIVTSPLVKVGGKGKSRKGTVQSGSIQKKTMVSAVVRDKDDPREDGDEWRPSPEEYKKMSSKEKRQLRNKISARNFRVRRKEYITTLEGDIAERDRLIDAIRTELGSSQSENAALRQEISALKKAILACAGRAESPVLPPPGPIPSHATATRPTTSSPLVTPNTQKDLPSSPRLAASASKAFWGGSAAFGGVTPVHTTLIPENFVQPLASVKPLAGGRAQGSILQQENINPLLNSSKSGLFANPYGGLSKVAPFDTFAEANPFTMKMLDAYRMQLWTRMAQYQPAQPQQQPPTSVTGLAAGLRPHYFMSSRNPSSSVSSLLSGKHTSAYPTPPPSPKLAPAPALFTSTKELPTPQQAFLATIASQTLLQQLGNAFWQAFTDHPSPPEATPDTRLPTWDAEKIQRVLEGKAILKVVDIEPEEKLRAALVPTSAQTSPNDAKTRDCSKEGSITSVLEEGMRALSLGKK
ncbi:hypothetical protein B0F90DRAFT_1719972 [Multifurca ochricompacta]|uniref:BZIP domain-containing protein n=1 Tax=Multifurca ochricompacta TaxID=376703 RepID=A0AAD4QNR8_9AGAM|nr:hypothetical protein B0F90DRAFT_1719972 [Multifurca ochricompacta]